MTIRAEILKREDELLEAIKSSDIISLDKLLHNECLFIMPHSGAGLRPVSSLLLLL